MDSHPWAWFFRELHTASMRRHSPHDPDTVDRLSRARVLLERRYHEPLTLEDLARAACYSRFHFLRLWKEAHGETPGRYLQRRRMLAARALLRDTDLPVTDVSRQVGFASLGTFSRTFRDETGLPPVQYRKRVFLGVDARLPRVPGCFLQRFAIPEKRAGSAGR
jgi:AraC-like DNA-binding protein